MAVALEVGTRLGIIEEFAIEDDVHRPVFVTLRLLPVRQIDDAQAPRRQADTGLLIESFLVGTAMRQGVRHGPKRAPVGRTASVKIDQTRDAAHAIIVERFADEWCTQ